jgi:low affinity Fe/Cu permease
MGGWLQSAFQRFARRSVRASGHPFAFGIALSVILLWLLMGPWFHFGNTWLLFIDTVGNIITFLMIFLIHNAHNRESEAVQLKLDELIRATKSAHNSLLDIEELSEAELDRIKARFERLARTARAESASPESSAPPPSVGRPDVVSDTATGAPSE